MKDDASLTIAQFIDTRVMGGAEVVVGDLLIALKERGIRGLLFHFGLSELESSLNKNNIQTIELDSWSYYKSSISLPFFCRNFRKLLAREKVDVLHSHLYGSVIGGTFSTAFSSLKHVGSLHDKYSLEESFLRPRMLKFCSILGTKLSSVSAEIAKSISAESSLVRVIPNGVSLPLINSEATSEVRLRVRNTLKIDDNEIVVTCVARFVALKSQESLIDAFAKLTDNRSIRLIFAGDGPTLSHCMDKSKALGLEDRIDFLGFTSNVSDLLTASDIFALSSTTEGLSRSILEAMGHGLPVIATNVGGNSELVEHNVSGLLIKPNSPDDYLENLQRLVGDSDLRQRLATAARERVARDYSQERMVNSYLSMYGLNNV